MGSQVALLTIGIFSAVVAFLAMLAAWRSASASRASAKTAKDTLAEARTQHALSVRPNVAVDIEKNRQRRADPGALFAPLSVSNAGPGVALNVQYDLIVTVSATGSPDTKQSFRDTIPHLYPGPKRPLHPFRNARPCLNSGIITYQDIEGRRYSSRYDMQSGQWQFADGDTSKSETAPTGYSGQNPRQT